MVRRVKTNMFGYMGIEWDNSRKKFQAILRHEGVRYKLGRFETAEMAAIAYDHKARSLRGSEARVNFPREGENSVVPTQKPEKRCPEGHPYEVHGKKAKNGDVVCRICNREAQRRYKERLIRKMEGVS